MDKITIEHAGEDDKLYSIAFEIEERSVQEIREMLHYIAEKLPRLLHAKPGENIDTPLQ